MTLPLTLQLTADSPAAFGLASYAWLLANNIAFIIKNDVTVLALQQATGMGLVGSRTHR